MAARILIIEDNPANLELMVYLLEAYGHHVDTESNGAVGLAAARRGVHDLVITDLHMPLLDGIGVAQALKSDPLLRSIPLVAVTAFAMENDRLAARAAGFDGFITKPIEPADFVPAIQAYLSPGKRGQFPAPQRAR